MSIESNYFLTSGTHGLTATATRNPSGILTIGNNSFTLTCHIRRSNDDELNSVVLKRLTSSGHSYETIVSYPPPSSSFNVTYQDQSLSSRTTPSRPDSSTAPTAILEFKDTLCADKGGYQWVVSYFDGVGNIEVVDFTIDSLKALSTFRNNGVVTFTPTLNIKEGDEVTFTCTGNVGGNPVGELVWYLYKHGATTGGEEQSAGVTSNPAVAEPGNPCSFSRTSALRLRMTWEMDEVVVRCTAQQDIRTEIGDNNDNYKQSQKIHVQYSPKNVSIVANPAMDIIPEGLEELTLTCSANSNPKPRYSWVLPTENSISGIEMTGTVLRLKHVRQADTGRYTCVVQTVINGQNFTASTAVEITVHSPDNAGIPVSALECSGNTVLVAVIAVLGTPTGILLIAVVLLRKQLLSKGSNNSNQIQPRRREYRNEVIEVPSSTGGTLTDQSRQENNIQHAIMYGVHTQPGVLSQSNAEVQDEQHQYERLPEYETLRINTESARTYEQLQIE